MTSPDRSADRTDETAHAEPLADVEQHWPVVASTDLHRDDWVVALRADQVVPPDRPDATPFRRLTLEHPGAVIVLAIDDRERVLVLRQYRHPAGRRFVELPAGLMDAGPDETAQDVAARELREEAQLAADDWTPLVASYPSPGISAEVHHLFVARGLRPEGRGDFALEHEEADMTTAWVPFADLYDAVVAGRLTDSPLSLAVLLARARSLA